MTQTLNNIELSPGGIARLLDHAILQPLSSDEAMQNELVSLRDFPLASVCIKPYAVALAARELRGTPIGIGTVIGFPHGSALPEVKALETERALQDGAVEADMVINIGKAQSGDWDYIREDIGAVLQVVRTHGGLLKVIFESGIIESDAVKIRLCEICSELGVDFVKTSTGYGYTKGADGLMSAPGASDHDLRLMRAHCAPSVGVKASGGMRSLDDVLRVIEIGVTRIGTSSTFAILSQARERFSGESGAAIDSKADY